MRRVLALCLIVFACPLHACAADGGESLASTVIRIDVERTAQPLLGVGAHIWTGDTHVEPVLRELELRYVRLTVGPNWPDVGQAPPADTTREVMDRFLVQHFDGDAEPRLESAKATWRIIDRLGLQAIMIQFDAPHTWLTDDGQRRLRPEHLDDFARYWGSLVAFMDRHGMRPPYIELANEVEGNWNTRIPSGDYNQLVIQVRRELDDRGFGDVGIVGPGLAFLDHDRQGKQWVEALTDEGVDSLSGWSTHVWDEKIEPEAPARHIAERWRNFMQAVRTKDPERTKPIFVTEYASGTHIFNGVTYDLVESRGSSRASDSNAFAQRVYEQTLIHVNLGASVLILWEAADQPWSHQAWGLAFGPKAERRRPAYYALKPLITAVPGNAVALKPSWDDPSVTLAGWIGEGALVLGIANGTDRPERRVLHIQNAPGLELLEAIRFDEQGVAPVSSAMTHGKLEVYLPPGSTLTCRFKLDAE